MYAVMTWLELEKWPLIFPEVAIPRGLLRGRVDVAAASKGFRHSAAVEVKAIYVQDSPEDQLSKVLEARIGRERAPVVNLQGPSGWTDPQELADCPAFRFRSSRCW